MVDFQRDRYYIVERKLFDNFLYEAAVQRGAGDFTGCRLTDAAFDESAGCWTVTLKQRSGGDIAIRSRILVGADGASSRVRRISGLDLDKNAHGYIGVRAYAQAEGLDEEAVRVDFLTALMPGYGWAFPLGNGKANIGIGLDVRDYRGIGKSLKAHLDDYIRHLAGEGVRLSNLRDIRSHPLPLGSGNLPLVPGRHVALIGDAAAMIDPFTGEGLHYGVWAGYALGRAVAEGIREGDPQAGLIRFEKAYAEEFGGSMERSQSLRVTLRFQRMFL